MRSGWRDTLRPSQLQKGNHTNPCTWCRPSFPDLQGSGRPREDGLSEDEVVFLFSFDVEIRQWPARTREQSSKPLPAPFPSPSDGRSRLVIKVLDLSTFTPISPDG